MGRYNKEKARVVPKVGDKVQRVEGSWWGYYGEHKVGTLISSEGGGWSSICTISFPGGGISRGDSITSLEKVIVTHIRFSRRK